ncbi:hypothetical protein Z043-111182 [Arapaima gigas]
MLFLRRWKHSSYSALFLLSCVTLLVEGSCPDQCSCPPPPPSCPPGVSWAMDACGCCRVCAQQFNQDCGRDQPCDHIKGLRCQMGAGGDPERGLCQAEAQGRPCEFDGRFYQHGEDFKPSCRHQCSCIDGVVGCMPLCPHWVPLPHWHCSRPRLSRPPGSCCDEWVCNNDNHIAEDSGEPQPGAPPVPQPHPDPASNELLLVPLPLGISAGTPLNEGMSLPMTHALLTSKCFPQITDWSPCSATCGMGVSSRITSTNSACRLMRETRLCQVRLCDTDLAPSPRGERCEHTVRPLKPIHITFAGCSTVRRYRPKTCGSCGDGRCCTPLVTRTVRLRFRCPGRHGFTRDVMWVQRCHCDISCLDASPAASIVPPNLPSDIHTYGH